MNKYKKFIKEAYNGKLGLTMCQDWKQKIEIEFPELLKTKNQELEIGKWHKDSEGLHFIELIENGIAYGYGFIRDKYIHNSNKDGISCLRNSFWMTLPRRLATEEEVKQALIKEAEKRGYKDGIYVNSFVHNRVLKIKDSNNNAEFINYMNKLHFGVDSNLCVVIFYHGKWAEIIQNTITKSEAEKQLNAKIIG